MAGKIISPDRLKKGWAQRKRRKKRIGSIRMGTAFKEKTVARSEKGDSFADNQGRDSTHIGESRHKKACTSSEGRNGDIKGKCQRIRGDLRSTSTKCQMVRGGVSSLRDGKFHNGGEQDQRSKFNREGMEKR